MQKFRIAVGFLPAVFAIMAVLSSACRQPDGTASTPAAANSWDVMVLAGASPLKGDAPAATGGYKDGPASNAEFDRPAGIAFDEAGNLYIADSGNHRIRRISPGGDVTTVAGSGKSGAVDGPALSAEFRTPVDVTFGPDGTLYIVDSEASQVRSLGADGMVRTVAGFDVGSCQADRKAPNPPSLPAECDALSTGQPFQDGPAAQAVFAQPTSAVVLQDGSILVADASNNCIRKISNDGIVSTFAGTRSPGAKDGAAAEAQFFSPVDMALTPEGSVIVTEAGNHVREISKAGVVRTVAGAVGLGDGSFQDGQGSSARFNSPGGLAVAPDGTIFLADTQNERVRSVAADGTVTTIAGIGGQGFATGDGSQAQFSLPTGMAVAPDGTLRLADFNLNRIFSLVRKP